VTHCYRGRWAATTHQVPTIAGPARPTATIGHRSAPTHTGPIGSASYTYGPTRLARSVIQLRSLHGTAHTTTETGLTVSACLDDGVYPTGLRSPTMSWWLFPLSRIAFTAMELHRWVWTDAETGPCRQIKDQMTV